MKEEVINQELDKDQWKLEAQAIINDVKQHICQINFVMDTAIDTIL